MSQISVQKLNQALSLLENQLNRFNAQPFEIVVCGGSALIATNLIMRTTKDLDIVAMVNTEMVLVNASPLPEVLKKAAAVVAQNLNLPDEWLNAGPASMINLGFPEGFQSRLIKNVIGSYLTVYYISRLDQIHFKLYASVDRGGYHIEDLLKLNPTEDELVRAAKWSCTHDVSEGYLVILRELLIKLGFNNAADRV